jgi:hypothetical protein
VTPLPKTGWEFAGLVALQYGPAIIAAVGVIWTAFQNRGIHKLQVLQTEKVDKLEHHMNAMREQLVTTTAAGSHAAGMIQGASEEQARAAIKIANADASAHRLEEIRGGSPP